ncbi:MAG: GDSL-type esterase/lipase family protein [Bacteroidales bacterium]|nr:GDSL-type esterase/lipase family protein [Bacteroidales bacterium]
MKRLLFPILALTAWIAAGAQQTTSPEYGVFYYQRASLFDELPIDSADIVMLGNSLTNGGEWHELLGMPNVKNRGITSDVIQGIRDRLDPIIAGQPAKIFLLTGTNDVSHDLGVDSIATAYGELIDYMREQMPRTELYVQSILPINISYGKYQRMADKEQQIRDINARLAEMAPAKGYVYIDLYSLMVDPDGHMRSDLTNDGIHLLGPGYLIWRDAILPYFNEK